MSLFKNSPHIFVVRGLLKSMHLNRLGRAEFNSLLWLPLRWVLRSPLFQGWISHAMRLPTRLGPVGYMGEISHTQVPAQLKGKPGI